MLQLMEEKELYKTDEYSKNGVKLSIKEKLESVLT